MRLNINLSARRRLRALTTASAWAATLLASSLLMGGPPSPSGAIFTTTPDGGIVNENVHYDFKREVYLDGGPPRNAPASAAGLDVGCYVFQITDPPGKLLLSEDPAKCRVVYVSTAGVITELVPPSEFATTCEDDAGNPIDNRSDDYAVGNGKNPTIFPCHVADPPHPNDPAGPDDWGPSERHDTNVDVDHGFPDPEEAIVVQMMPYGTTPNPGGVYKAWMTPIGAYLSLNGDLDEVPAAKKGKVKPHDCPDFCADADPGFGKPNARVKTDNFKVKEIEPSMLHVRKFKDANYNGIWDEGEPEIGVDVCVDEFGFLTDCLTGGGWPVSIQEPGDTPAQDYWTPVWLNAFAGIWTIDEGLFDDWIHSATFVDGVATDPPADPVDVVFASDYGEEHEVVFGNACTANLGGQKFIDANANAAKDEGEGCPGTCAPGVNEDGCVGVTVKLTGTSGMNETISKTTTTGPDGSYVFEDVPPGTYTIGIEEPAGFECLLPGTVPSCEEGWEPPPCEYVVEVHDCMADVLDLDFGDYSDVEVHGQKRKADSFDGGEGICDSPLEGRPDVQIILEGTDGWGCTIWESTYTCGGINVPDCMGQPVGSYWFTGLRPGDYTVREVTPTGYTTLCESCSEEFALCSDETRECDIENGICDGLTPGYWGNWRNHYTWKEFCSLLEGTISDIGTCNGPNGENIQDADATLESIGCDGDDATHCMSRFLLSDQLTINLTGRDDIFNPLQDGLGGQCSIDAQGDLQACLDKGIAIHDADGFGYTRDEILDNKNCLAAFAEL